MDEKINYYAKIKWLFEIYIGSYSDGKPKKDRASSSSHGRMVKRTIDVMGRLYKKWEISRI